MSTPDVGTALAGVDWFGLVLVPLAIFCARIIDQSVGTMRIVFVSRGMPLQAAVSGFFESLIWLLAVSQIIQHLTMPLYYIAYACGFAAGNYVGLLIERRLAMGNVILRLTTSDPVADLLDVLRASGHGATLIKGEGLQGPVHIVQSVLPRRDLAQVLAGIKAIQPKAFFTLEPVSRADQGVFPGARLRRSPLPIRQRK